MATDRFEEFKNTYPESYNNIVGDKTIPEKDKEAFFEAIKNFSDGDLKQFVLGYIFREDNWFLGAQARLGSTEILGRIIMFESFSEHLSKIADLDYDQAVRRLDALIYSAHPSDALDFIKTEWGAEKLSPRPVMWSFQNPSDITKPYNNGIKLEDLPCVLGLKGYEPPFICLSHKLPANIAYKPTAFNAGIDNEFYAWGPGGRTIPLSACENEYEEGLPELVHETNTFNDLCDSLKKII